VKLFLRSLFWTVAMPGVVAGYVPWALFGLREARFEANDLLQVVGFACALAGVALLLACIVEFARIGRGTLSPVDPPRALVVRGLYRYVRNPMYLSVSMIVLGEAAIARSIELVGYWAAVFLAANLFVILYEEPNLRGRFGASFDEYTRQVWRWIPRFPK
jgi:protein-S-isoprenylcysteine O-methyltransferase Ste14